MILARDIRVLIIILLLLLCLKELIMVRSLEKFFLGALLVVFITSCVGTIEDKNPPETKAAEVGGESIAFSGLTRVIPIAHNKVELYFSPAPGAPNNLVYLIFVNNSQIPIEVSGSSLEITTTGEYRYTLRNLAVNTLYDFAVGVRNTITGDESSTNRSLQARTFSNITANFDGITALYAAPGIQGTSSLVAEWIPAETLGSEFIPRITDPIAYEIKYMPTSAGSPLLLNENGNPNVITQQIPSAISNSSPGSTERSRALTGLEANTSYYVQVRAIHKSYASFMSDPNYKFEQNTKFLRATTAVEGALLDFDLSSFRSITPAGFDGLSRIDFRWTQASGPFLNYRLYIRKVAEPNANAVTLSGIVDTLTSENVNTLNASPANYTAISPDKSSQNISNLQTYAYYQAKLAVCADPACSEEERFLSDLVSFRVVPLLASFDGLTQISNPQDIADVSKINLSFEAPVISTGILTGVEVYCHSDLLDPNPVLVPFNTPIADGTKVGCDGLRRLTANPSTLNAYSNFKNIEIDGIRFSGAVAENTYCLSAIPVIIDANYIRRDIDRAVVRCARPEIVVPTQEEFAGPRKVCSVSSDSLTAQWNLPLGGIYNNFEVFWKLADGTPFNYTAAINGDVGYFSQDGIGATTTSHTILNLEPGRRYQYGVLAYTVVSGQRIYSETNSNNFECQLNNPVATFVEWIDVAAVGPKENGLAPLGSDDRFLLETFDKDFMPIEVNVDAGSNPTDLFNAQFGNRSGSTQFSGVYGAKDYNSTSAPLHQYSNSGMVRLVWKDVLVSGQLQQSLLAKTPASDLALAKNQRKFGYKVYRSEDGKLNWKELTSDEYDFQTIDNAGLLTAAPLTERPRSNLAQTTHSAVVFTDYSVQAFDYRNLEQEDQDRIDRARVYYYRIVPVFNGKEINFVDSNSARPQNIIRVTLPPKNRALVHRMIANRMTCLELGRPYVADINQHYTCDFNGAGARGLSYPWTLSTMVYDLGGDLLVDRFEMGCDISRGDLSNTDSLFGSGTANDSYNFLGNSNTNGDFKGCLMSSRTDVTSPSFSKPRSPGQLVGDLTPADGVAFDNFRSIITGDCLGDDYTALRSGSSVCADPLTREVVSYVYPGARAPNATTVGDPLSCESPENLIENFFDLWNTDTRSISFSRTVAQSEFLGRYHMTHHRNQGGFSRSVPSLRSGQSLPTNDSELRPTIQNNLASCFINLPAADTTEAGRLKPRWLALNQLSEIDYIDENGDNTSTIDILNAPLSQILSDTRLYENARNSLPDQTYLYPTSTTTGPSARYREQTPLSRVMTSNAAKLPPVNQLGQEQLNSVCNEYKIEIGQTDSTGNYFRLAAPKGSNLLRKKEFIASSAWSSNFTTGVISALERGDRDEAAVDTGFSGTQTFNGSCNDAGKSVGTVNSSSLYAGEFFEPRLIDSRNNPGFFTGSSFYDSATGNTQKCQSRFGIQDLIGNRSEMGTERFFCDFTQEKMYVGTRDDVSNSVEISPGDVVDENLTVWVLSTVDSGRCSPVSAGDDRARQLDSGFVPRPFDAGGVIAPVADALGNIDTNFILRSWPFDQLGVEQFRNGDGYFHDFGTTSISPPMQAHDTLSLNATTRSEFNAGQDSRRGKSFNPVIGLPLECNGDSCDLTDDNNMFTTAALRARTGIAASNYEIADFPVSNSQITSDGMAEIGRNDTFQTLQTVCRSYTYIESIDPANPDPALRVITNTRNTCDTDTFHRAYQYTFSVSRNATYVFRNGGHSSRSGSGRFAMDFKQDSNAGSNFTNLNSGRCSLMINMN